MRTLLSALTVVLTVALTAVAESDGVVPGSARVPPPARAGAQKAPPPKQNLTPNCSGRYGEDVSALLPRARAFEQEHSAYTFCIRSSAVYECPFYGTDGVLRKTRRRVVAHGTGFAYRLQENGTLLFTNQHVAEWPPTTDEGHRLDDVPAGCRRVSDEVKIVDNQSDDYERDDILLSRVVSDPQLDAAILRARVPLPVMPWKFGQSAGLSARDLVNVRGFPLGIFKADTLGKVISAYDHDEYGDWDHDDFVIDALLSPGNSGSPVLAISCTTGEFELVGVYHAAYSHGSALNVAVGIDQLRDLMVNLKRSSPVAAAAPALEVRDRTWLLNEARSTLEPFFPFGKLPAVVRVRADGALLFEIFSEEFPLRSTPLLVLEDLPVSGGDFGTLGRAWLGSPHGLKAYPRSELDAESLGQALRVLDAARRDALLAFQYKFGEANSDGTRQGFERAKQVGQRLRRRVALRRELERTAAELSDRLGPGSGEPTVTIADALIPEPGAEAVTSDPVREAGAPRAMVGAKQSVPVRIDTAADRVGQ